MALKLLINCNSNRYNIFKLIVDRQVKLDISNDEYNDNTVTCFINNNKVENSKNISLDEGNYILKMYGDFVFRSDSNTSSTGAECSLNFIFSCRIKNCCSMFCGNIVDSYNLEKMNFSQVITFERMFASSKAKKNNFW